MPAKKKKRFRIKKETVQKVTYHLNLSARICDHVMGDQHTVHHRKAAGVILMVIGVTFMKEVGHLVINTLAEIPIDMLGGALHGAGLVPFLEKEEKKFEKKIEEEEKKL